MKFVLSLVILCKFILWRMIESFGVFAAFSILLSQATTAFDYFLSYVRLTLNRLLETKVRFVFGNNLDLLELNVRYGFLGSNLDLLDD